MVAGGTQEFDSQVIVEVVQYTDGKDYIGRRASRRWDVFRNIHAIEDAAPCIASASRLNIRLRQVEAVVLDACRKKRQEFARAASIFPIVFLEDKEKDEFRPVVLLGLNAGSSVFLLTRILKLNDTPVCYEEVRLPPPRLKGLTAAVVRQHECMLYSMYETRFGMRVLHAEERLKAVGAPREVSAFLQVPAGTPMLQIERIAFSYRHEPAELRHCLCDTRLHHYRNSITG